MKTELKVGILCVILGLLLVVSSVSVISNFESISRTTLGKKLVLAPSSGGSAVWNSVSDNYVFKVGWYFFNLTNPDEFQEGALPTVNEVGPFWYAMNLTKRNVVFHENKTVSYEEWRLLTFDETGSVGDENTKITIVNVPLMVVAQVAQSLSKKEKWYLEYEVSVMADSEIQAFGTFTVQELTYMGKKNPIVELAEEQVPQTNNTAKGRFGFAVNTNDTNPSIFNVYTGETGVTDLNRIHSENGEHNRTIWPLPECNIVDGTLGVLRPPMNESISIERIYVPDMCRTLTMRYQNDIYWHKIRLRRFNLTIDNFQSSKENPENVCYDSIFNLPSGVAEVGPCKTAAPILVSLPHFLQADSTFHDDVIGLSPDVSKHESIMDHEPTTGVTVRARARAQVNIRVIPSDFIYSTKEIPTVTIPLFWKEQYIEGGERIAGSLVKVNGYFVVGKMGLTIVALLGLILGVIGAGLIITSSMAQRKPTI